MEALKPYQKDYDYSYSIGVFPTLELLMHRPEIVIKVLVSSRGSDNEGLAKIKMLCGNNDISVELNDRKINQFSKSENCYAIGIFRKFNSNLDDSRNHLLLVNPSDMGNMGTIIRTCIGFEFSDIALIKPAVDVFNPKVIRSSMGAIFKARFQYFDNFEQYSKTFSRNFYPFMLDANQDLEDVIFDDPVTLIFGNEGSGLTESFLHVGTAVRIPQSKEIDSLNLSIAVGIACYKVYQGRNGS